MWRRRVVLIAPFALEISCYIARRAVEIVACCLVLLAKEMTCCIATACYTDKMFCMTACCTDITLYSTACCRANLMNV